MSLLRAKEPRTEVEALRARIASLRERAEALERGAIAPRRLLDEVLWLCPECRRIMTDLPRLHVDAIQPRIDAQIHRFERTLATLTRRAG